MALIAVLATVAVPGPVGSRAMSPVASTRTDLFTTVEVDASVRGPALTIQPLDPGARSDATLDHRSTMFEPAQRTEPPQARPRRCPAGARSAGRSPRTRGARTPRSRGTAPGLIGNGTACGQTLTRSLVGVAHRTLPCGTKITFRYEGTTLTVPVVDRGPFVGGRIFDLTYGACKKLDHCHTGPIQWRYGQGQLDPDHAQAIACSRRVRLDEADQALALGLQGPSVIGSDPSERLEPERGHALRRRDRPEAGHESVDQEGRQEVAVLLGDGRAMGAGRIRDRGRRTR